MKIQKLIQFIKIKVNLTVKLTNKRVLKID